MALCSQQNSTPVRRPSAGAKMEEGEKKIIPLVLSLFLLRVVPWSGTGEKGWPSSGRCCCFFFFLGFSAGGGILICKYADRHEEADAGTPFSMGCVRRGEDGRSRRLRVCVFVRSLSSPRLSVFVLCVGGLSAASFFLKNFTLFLPFPLSFQRRHFYLNTCAERGISSVSE